MDEVDRFVKRAPAAELARLQAEAEGLATLAATQAITVPAVQSCGIDDETGQARLVMDRLDLRPPDAGFGARLGEALGRLHAAVPEKGDGRFGWDADNFIGATPQVNGWSAFGGVEDWIAFHREQRLGAMARRLARSGAAIELLRAVEDVQAALPRFFDDGHVPRASLIHGDLWSGNWGMLPDGRPVIFDPAVSVSDAEAELAMMELFGSLPADFWPAWRAVMGPHEGYPRRRGLYQLYHLLNHALLFGGGYAAQSLAMTRKLLRSA
ncbi:fructosamine kinase family protein [Ideonella sp. YS5]|uniref:fructosamine kinase family protein n=1 Tax=Ideonella sp. YS5 TaxID=3453714 RepID=UPI003EEC751B